MSAHTMEEDVFTGKMDFALWRKMLRFALPHKSKILPMMALGAVVSCFDICLPFLTGRIVDAVTAHGAATNLHKFMFVYGCVIAGFVCCIFSFIMLAGRITVVDQLRHPRDLFRQASATCRSPITIEKRSAG